MKIKETHKQLEDYLKNNYSHLKIKIVVSTQDYQGERWALWTEITGEELTGNLGSYNDEASLKSAILGADNFAEFLSGELEKSGKKKVIITKEKDKFITKEISGLASAFIDMRKPMKSKNDTVFLRRNDGTLYFNELGKDDERLARNLSSCKGGTGHDSFLKDIVVHLDITATHDFIIQLYRYHFRDTASSESKMYGITKLGSIGENCSEYVSPVTVDLVDSLIALYNDFDAKVSTDDYTMVFHGLGLPLTTNKKTLFEMIIHNTPLGYELTFGEVVNYLQLKSMYKQRKNHKMSSWSTHFKKWVESLPYSWLITSVKKQQK